MSKNSQIYFKFFLLLAVSRVVIWAGMVAKLPELERPSWVRILDNRMYIVDNFSIQIYTIPGFRLEKTFLKQGAGPQEVAFYPKLDIVSEKLIINSFDKLLIYSPSGSIIKEMKIKPYIDSVYPIGTNFVGTWLDIKQGKDKYTQYISIYDQKLNKIREIFHGDTGGFTIVNSDNNTKKQKMEMIKDNVEHYVYKNRIYISDTTKGLFFLVFDINGNKLYEINAPYEKHKVSDDYKNKILNERKNSPFYNKYNYTFKDYFPAFKYFKIADDKIYLMTYPWRINNCDLIILDLKGKFLKKTIIPDTYMFAISQDKFYYLKENEEDEDWEVFIEPIR